MNRQKRHRRFTCLFAALVLLAGCDLFGSDEEPGPVMVSEQSAQFGMRAIYGLKPEAATNTSPVIFFGIFLDDNGNILSHGEERVRVMLNGNEVNESYEFDHQPDNEYEFEASLGDEPIRASVKAPDIDGRSLD